MNGGLGEFRLDPEVEAATSKAQLLLADAYLHRHQRNTARLARAIAQKLGMSHHDTTGLVVGALLHDVGKREIPRELMAKTDTLTKEEYALIRTHAELGANLLLSLRLEWPISEIVRQHHERFDGSGYPRGLKGDAILWQAQVIGICDTIDSLIHHRPYRPGGTIRQAILHLTRARGGLYRSDLAGAAITILKERKVMEILENDPGAVYL
jgi:putative two-component system response regulator